MVTRIGLLHAGKLAKAGVGTGALQAYLGHRNIPHTVHYTELAPDRFKDFWRDHAVVVREWFDRVVTAQPFAELCGQRSNYQAGFQAMVGTFHHVCWTKPRKFWG
jgi:hypothetical protein